jgi:hypothetical protein
MINVKHLSKAAIEKEAELLLADYEDTIGGPIELPVPISDITTSHLALDLRFADLGQPDILGAIYILEELVLIHQHLDPGADPFKLGRYNFTVAHEIGHWQLHRSYVANSPKAMPFDAPSHPTFICRSSQKHKPIEWQANRFASCLLMPRRRVLDEWKAFLNDARDTDGVLAAALPNGTWVKHSQAMIYARTKKFHNGGHDLVCEEVTRPIAERFGASVEAMRIRLEELGLLAGRSKVAVG